MTRHAVYCRRTGRLLGHLELGFALDAQKLVIPVVVARGLGALILDATEPGAPDTDLIAEDSPELRRCKAFRAARPPV